MTGIDAPELNGADRGRALAAKHFLAELIERRDVEIMIVRQWPDRYGRMLGTIYLGNIDLSQVMLDNGHAKPYFTQPLIV